MPSPLRKRPKYKGRLSNDSSEKLYSLARTAVLLRTEMSILRDDRMRPLFQEAIVTKLAVTQSITKASNESYGDYLSNDTP